ncbi:TPT domain-containing protein [Aphelenchoides fujianensis]|nr:TPT domain-containing protein [Aphelenchoides fujianensis]
MPTEVTSFAKVGSAVFFGVTFPSFLYLGLGQMSMTLVVLFVAERCGIVSFPRCDRTMPRRRIFPLPIFYLLNLISGLGGTQKLNLPMFTVLRRISILLTMVFEFFLLKMQFPFAIKVSVFLMIFGSFIAAIYDLTFDAYGYTLIMINNICTAANVVTSGQYGLLYYNALFMIVPAMFIALLSDDTERVREFVAEGHFTGAVWFCFILSSICGFILNYSSVLCTHYNSPLTTTCNLFVTYVGMISSGDYIFQWANFIGVNSDILYTYVTFRRKGLQNSRQITVNPVEKEKLIP